MKTPLILASSSPFRRTLLANAGLSFEARPADIDERAIEAELEESHAHPEQVAVTLARAKAMDVARHFPGSLVIGSDQTMSLGERVYHKPRTLDVAKDHIRSLSGKTHRLNSGVVLVRDGSVLWEHVSHADMTVRPLGDTFIDGYVARCGEKLLQSVGAYQLEGEGIQLFSHIQGDYFTILGLPMLPLLAKLRDLEALDG